MKVVYSGLFLLAFFAPPLIQAGSVEKCVDPATGKITYTDKGCKGKETSQEAYLINSANSNKNSRGNKTGASASTVSFKVSEIGLLTEQAYEQCNKQAAKYFSDSHPSVKERPESDFAKVVDRSIKGTEVEIKFAGTISYKHEKETKEMNLLCTATKSRENPDWTLVYSDSKTAATTN